jgi:hypothetical protein
MGRVEEEGQEGESRRRRVGREHGKGLRRRGINERRAGGSWLRSWHASKGFLSRIPAIWDSYGPRP